MLYTNDKVLVPPNIDDMCCPQHDAFLLDKDRIEAIVLEDSVFDESCETEMVLIIDAKLDTMYIPTYLVKTKEH